MKRVSFEIKGKKAVLGRMSYLSAIIRQINAADTPSLWWDTPSANVNFPPDALPDTGLLAMTRVCTPDGPACLSDLTRGDTVIDHTGQSTEVLSVTAAGKSRAALRLRSPYFGLDQDLVVGDTQCLWMQSDRAEQMFGHEDVLMPIWALKDQNRVQYIELGPRDVLLEIKLASGNAVMVGNCAVATRQIEGEKANAYALSDSEARGFSTAYRAGYFKT